MATQEDEFAELAMFTFRAMTQALEAHALGAPLPQETLRQLPNSIALTFKLYWREKQARAEKLSLTAA